jgi:hypothetical protein
MVFVKRNSAGMYARKKLQWLRLACAQKYKRPERIPIDKLLIGQQAGYPLELWIAVSGETERMSQPVALSPYVQFLLAIKDKPERLNDDSFLKETSYFRMAMLCMEHTGHFMGADNQEHLFTWMRDFYRYATAQHSSDKVSAFQQKGHSPQGSPVMVAGIKHSDCYEIIDGHHRIAAAYINGQHQIDAIVAQKKWSVLQKLLLEVNQINDIELYQPVDRLEVASWPAVRICSDRYAMMQQVMEQQGIQQGSVIDLACSYGWFLKQFKANGFAVTGVDRDAKALRVASLIHGLSQEETVCERVEDFLPKEKRQWDVVLFLSILHHYALGIEPGKAEEMLAHLDRISGKVLFLDTGQNHEKWFRKKLPQWNDAYIIDMIRRHTSFRQVIALGKDRDNKGKYVDNYQRTLFACIR